jgi:hypothetical protein
VACFLKPDTATGKINDYEIYAYKIGLSSSHIPKSEAHHGFSIINSNAFSVDLQQDILNIWLIIP